LKRTVIAFAWWFLAVYNDHPIVVGPFNDQAVCEATRKSWKTYQPHPACWEGDNK